MPSEAWQALVEAFQLFLLGTGDQHEQPSTSPSHMDGSAPTSPSSAKAQLSNGPAALDQHHLISGDSRASLKAAQHLAAQQHAALSDVDSDEALLESAGQADAELEAAVLDTLTENVLVSSAKMPSESRQAAATPDTMHHPSFSQQKCIRSRSDLQKMPNMIQTSASMLFGCWSCSQRSSMCAQ